MWPPIPGLMSAAPHFELFDAGLLFGQPHQVPSALEVFLPQQHRVLDRGGGTGRVQYGPRQKPQRLLFAGEELGGRDELPAMSARH
ncbi:hypothetical protein SVIOM342S_04803 [Streptomyces violaceorubidus]